MSEVTTEVEEAEAEEEHEREPPSRTRAVAEWAAVLVAAGLVALLIRGLLFQAFYIPSPSMVPTLEVDDRVLVNKLSYRLHDVRRGDVVVFRSPPHDGQASRDLIKRVIALPGETIEAHEGRLYINRRALKEPYLTSTDSGVGQMAPRQVPRGHYFLMGDNRANSTDSRAFGPIARSRIVGRAFLRVWPPGSLERL